jgi:galactokinase/mevalonate kinase-like predicted kinase
MMGESERPGTKRKSTVFLAVLLARQQLCSLEQGSNSALKRAGERRKRAGKLLAAVIAISRVEKSRHLTRHARTIVSSLCLGQPPFTGLGSSSLMMMILLLFLQKQNLAFAVYLFGWVLSLPD